jgi:hypothetical protein
LSQGLPDYAGGRREWFSAIVALFLLGSRWCVGDTNVVRLFDLRVNLALPAAATNSTPTPILKVELFFKQEEERPPGPVLIRALTADRPRGFGERLRSVPAGILEAFNLTEPLPGGPTPVIRPEDIPAAAQPLPRSMSAPYKSPPFISTGKRGIWNARD